MTTIITTRTNLIQKGSINYFKSGQYTFPVMLVKVLWMSEQDCCHGNSRVNCRLLDGSRHASKHHCKVTSMFKMMEIVRR